MEYRAQHKCRNCKTQAWFDIPKGETVREYLQEGEFKCSYCGCVLVKKKKEDED